MLITKFRPHRVIAQLCVLVLVGGLTGLGVAGPGVHAVAWVPDSLAGLQFWVDFSDSSTVTSSGGSVSRVTDKSGNGRTLVQANSSDKPAIGLATKNGMNVLTFDGTDNMESPAWTQALPVTMFAVARNTENSGANRQIIGNTNRVSPVFYKSGNVWRLYSGSELVSGVSVDTGWHYLSGVVNSGSSQLRLDGTLIASGNTGGQSWNASPIAIGNSVEAGNGFGWIGDIAEIFIYSRVLTSAEITQVESYLNSKWFLAPTTTTTSTTTTTTSTTTTTVPATTTTVRPGTTTVAPALEIVVNAPATTAPAAPAGQVTVPASSVPLVTNTVVTQPTLKNAATPTTAAAPMVSTTTTTVPDNAGGTVAPPTPRIQVVQPGQAAVTVGDKAEAVTVERADNQLTVKAGALSATLGSIGKNGAVGALDSDGNVRLRPGDTVRIKLAGFEPGSEVEAWLFSTPVLMGTAKVQADGSVTGNFVIPKNAPTGAHRIAIVAKTTDGKDATLTVGVKVGDWKKERSITVWLIVLPIVLAVVGALTLPATRRRRRRGNTV